MSILPHKSEKKKMPNCIIIKILENSKNEKVIQNPSKKVIM